MAQAHYFARRFEEARGETLRVLEMDPHFPVAHLMLGLEHMGEGQHAEAIAAFERFASLTGGGSLGTALLGNAYARAGETKKARELLRRLEAEARRAYVPPPHLSLIHAGLGEKDQAFAWLEKGYQDRSDVLGYLRVEPVFDPLRTDPRFADLLRRIGLSGPGPSPLPGGR